MPEQPGTRTVFISSTFSDLAAERTAVAEAAERAGLSPVRFEALGATRETPQEVLARAVDDAALFVLLVAFRYGVTEPGADTSRPDAELERAVRGKKPVLVYMLGEDVPWPVSQLARTVDEADRVSRFRRRLTEQFVVRRFRDAADLKSQAYADFVRWMAGGPFHKPVKEKPTRFPGAEILLEIRSQLALLVQRSLAEPPSRPSGQWPLLQPADFLGDAHPEQPDRAFLIMPYSMEWSSAVERVTREACEAAGFVFDIAKARDGRFVIQDIWAGITSSGVTIADLTAGNPNVAYEVGLADVLGKRVILISQESDVPVDFRGSRLILYRNTIDGALELREQLADRLRALRGTGDRS